MHIRELSGKNANICILGFGKEGQATLRTLEHYAPDAAIFIADTNAQQENSEYPFITGPQYLETIDRQYFHTIIKSPGIPPHPLFRKWEEENRLTSATQIFFDSIVNTGAAVIGVTGSKGKSTTASLIYEILRASPHHKPLPSCHLIGNIGQPALDFLDKAKPGVIFVIELSSYQLMDLTRSPHIAVITSFFPDHLDYHGSLEAYKEAKNHITKFQAKDDIVFYASRDEGTHTIAMLSPGKKIPFSEEDAPVTLEETRLIGQHNLRNIAGAWKVAEYLGIPRDVTIDAIRGFHSLPHRLQSLGIHHGIEWIDDAISTTPESTIAALDALGDRVTTIILGGLDRGYDFTQLAERIAHSSIRTVILFPGSGPRIRHAIEHAHAQVTLHEVDTMDDAVSIAQRETRNQPFEALPRHRKLGIEMRPSPRARASEPRAGPNGKPETRNPPVVLLSTASPSYNMFKNFEEKGDYFQKAIASVSMTL